jgi:hypothetical protein
MPDNVLHLAARSLIAFSLALLILSSPVSAACTEHYVTRVYADGVELDGVTPVPFAPGSYTTGYLVGDVAAQCGSTIINLSKNARAQQAEERDEREAFEGLQTLFLLNRLRNHEE